MSFILLLGCWYQQTKKTMFIPFGAIAFVSKYNGLLNHEEKKFDFFLWTSIQPHHTRTALQPNGLIVARIILLVYVFEFPAHKKPNIYSTRFDVILI